MVDLSCYGLGLEGIAGPGMSRAVIGVKDHVSAGLLHRDSASPNSICEGSGIGGAYSYSRLRLNDIANINKNPLPAIKIIREAIAHSKISLVDGSVTESLRLIETAIVGSATGIKAYTIRLPGQELDR